MCYMFLESQSSALHIADSLPNYKLVWCHNIKYTSSVHLFKNYCAYFNNFDNTIRFMWFPSQVGAFIIIWLETGILCWRPSQGIAQAIRKNLHIWGKSEWWHQNAMLTSLLRTRLSRQNNRSCNLYLFQSLSQRFAPITDMEFCFCQ